jgi:hypothetical protein
LAFAFQREYQNALEAAHVDQVEAKGSGAGVLRAFRRVALGEAHQLLAPAQLGPGEGRIQ